MNKILKSALAPVSSLVIVMLGTGFFNTFVSIRVASLGWSTLLSSIIYSSYFMGMFIGALQVQKVLNITGHIRSFSIFASITAATVIIQGYSYSPILWIIARLITGFSCAGLFIVIESWLMMLGTQKTRGVALAIYMISLYMAQTVGQLIINFVDINGDEPFAICALFCSLSILPVCTMRAAAPTISDHEHLNLFKVLKTVPLGCFGNLISGMIISAFYSLGPVFAKESNFSTLEISLTMSTTLLGGMLLQWPIGIASDIFSKKKLIGFLASMLLIIGSILFLANGVSTTVIPTLFLYGGFALTLYPTSISYCCDFFSTKEIIAISTSSLMIYGIGCILGPFTSSLFMSLTNSSGLFLHSSVLSLILITILLLDNKKDHYSKGNISLN